MDANIMNINLPAKIRTSQILQCCSVPQNTDFPLHNQKRKNFVVHPLEKKRLYRKMCKMGIKLETPPFKFGLVDESLVPLAYALFNARVTVINNLKKLLRVVPVHACAWCEEVHVGAEGHPFQTCRGRKSRYGRFLHKWTSADVDDIFPPVEVYHLSDCLRTHISHANRFSVCRVPAIVELCIRAGMEIPKLPTKRRRKPVIMVSKNEFVDVDESELPLPSPFIPETPLLQVIPDSETVVTWSTGEERREAAEGTLEAWRSVREGVKKLMGVYSVRVCGYCPEVHVGPVGHKGQNCGAYHHKERNGHHGWQEATVDDLVPPKYVWHVPDVDQVPPLRSHLQHFYGMAPVVVEMCVQAGAVPSEEEKGTMRLGVCVPKDIEEAHLAV